MNKYLPITILIIISLTITTTAVFAQNDVEVRLQQIESKLATNSSKTATQEPTSNKNKDFSLISAEVISNSGSILTVSETENLKTIYTNDSTKFVNFDTSSKKLIGVGDIKPGDKVQIVGIPPLSTVGTAKLIVRDQRKKVTTFSLIGKIAEVVDSTISLGHFSRDDLPKQKLDLTTDYVILGSKEKSLERSVLTKDKKIVVSGIINDKGSFIGKQVFVPNQ